MYIDWGFRESPFQTRALSADEAGSRLLVGRSNELSRFGSLLASPSSAITIEGANGVGKTSLVNVAIYRAMDRYMQSGSGPLFVPALEALQLVDDTAVEPFLDQVYSLIARTLIQRAREIRQLGWSLPSTNAVEQWLNSPLIDRWGANLGFLGVQMSTSLNETEGYLRGGFRVEVRDWLRNVFPSTSGGGVVCLIDNLELLRTSAKARQLVEALRDPLFGILGVRWVLCGANGITRSVAGSSRLDGYLHSPIDVLALGEEEAAEMYNSRLQAYSRPGVESYLPLTEEDFVWLFDILASNTRSVLKYADGFCLSQHGARAATDEEKRSKFKEWLDAESSAHARACDEHIGGRAWLVFDQACREGTDFAPGDYERFGFNSQPVMVPHVSALESNGLVVSAIDEIDQRRRTISVTPKGWLVHYAREELGVR